MNSTALNASSHFIRPYTDPINFLNTYKIKNQTSLQQKQIHERLAHKQNKTSKMESSRMSID